MLRKSSTPKTKTTRCLFHARSNRVTKLIKLNTNMRLFDYSVV